MGVDARMCVRVPTKLDAAAVQKLSWEIGACFGTRPFYYDYPQSDPPVPALVIVDQYAEWDSDQVVLPPPGGVLLAVRLTDRYWGPGYERGNLPELLAIARWLEWKTGGDVWYGGDSSGTTGVKLDRAKREEWWALFVNSGNPYHHRHESAFSGTPAPDCLLCQQPTSHVGGGGDREFWRCNGCGWAAITSRAGLKALGWGLGGDAFFKEP